MGFWEEKEKEEEEEAYLLRREKTARRQAEGQRLEFGTAQVLRFAGRPSDRAW